MKHEAERQAPIVEDPEIRTSDNEGQASFGQNPAFLGRLREKATVPLAVAGVATGLLGAKMFAPAERDINQEALNSLKTRPVAELVLGSIETANATEAQVFPDVPSTNPYFEAINGMANAGVISGFDDGTFGPDKLVTRQQFAKIIVGTMSPTVVATEESWQDSNKPFNDLIADDPNSLYPNDYVAVAVQNGITQGKGSGKYAPYDNITRAQVDTMMVRAAKNLKPGLLVEPSADYQSSLGDFSPDHGEFLRWAEYNSLLDGLVEYDSSWDPFQPATRGEVAQMLWNLNTYEKQEKHGADLVNLQVVSRDSMPQKMQVLVNGIPKPQEITMITAEDPINASREVSFYTVKTADKSATGTYFIREQENGDLVSGQIIPQAIIASYVFKTYIAGRYIAEPGVDSRLFVFELGYPYQKLGSETQEMYSERMSQVVGTITQEHGDNGLIRLGEVKDTLSQAKNLFLINGSKVVAYSAESQKDAIAKIVNSF